MENVRFKKPGDRSLYIIAFLQVMQVQPRSGYLIPRLNLGFLAERDDTHGMVYKTKTGILAYHACIE